MNNDYSIGGETRGKIIIATHVNFISRMKNIYFVLTSKTYMIMERKFVIFMQLQLDTLIYLGHCIGGE